jgi:hypothetical protein
VVKFEVIGCVEMFPFTGVNALALIGHTTIKIRLGRYIDAAQHKSESRRTLQERLTMIVAADSGGQQEPNMC